jgi:hypothetical protein
MPMTFAARCAVRFLALGFALFQAAPAIGQQTAAVTGKSGIEEIVDRQQRAYNGRDLDATAALYARDSVLLNMNDGREIARGIAAVTAHFARRYRDSPKLHYEVKSRMVAGNFVIDHELVVGIGDGVLEVVAMYEVRDSLIQSVRFLFL